MSGLSLCADCAVRDAALCGSLDDVELRALNSVAQRRHDPRGSIVIWTGDESVICANVVSGVPKLATSTGDAR